MKAVGNNILIAPDKEDSIAKTDGGLLLTRKEKIDIRYKKATVIEVSDMIDVVKKGDKIYYDRHAGHKIELGKESYSVIKMQDVVVVL